MMVDTKDLVSTSGIAERLGCLVTTVSNWRKRHEDFPEPVAYTGPKGGAPIFLFSEVQKWYRERVLRQEVRRMERIAELKEELKRARSMDRRRRLSMELARLEGMS